MKASLRRIMAIIKKELKQLSRDKMTFGMVVMIPLIQLLLFGYAINTNVRNIPIGIVDLSGSSAARLISQAVSETEVVKISAHYDTPQQAEKAIKEGEVRAAIIYPHNLTQRISHGDIIAQIIVDGSDTVVSNALLQLRQMPLNEIIPEPALSRSNKKPTFEVALFFNPERRSAVNIVPGLIGVILTMTMILFTATAIVREREQGNLEMLITTPIHSMELMLGKIFPFIFVGLMQASIILSLGHFVFHVPINGTLINIFVVTITFISASLTFGLIISTLAKTQLQAMQMTVFILLPSILLSGFMFPYEGMPHLAQTIAEALPATHFMRMIRAVVLKGAQASELVYDMSWLLIFTVFGLLVAALRFHKRLD